ncbi:alpha-amylase [Bacteroidia bacterium]|nr:alpha-amylase [Bacteroidia bacterium]GHV43976.1 alpha-amylase [Bacteroidia bacterium]
MKFVIYQVLPRLFGNYFTANKHNGTIEENGCGKFNSFSDKALNEIRDFGATHIYFTGILEHATRTDYSRFDIRKDHNALVKGNAGAPFAVKDYYDVNPDLAENVPDRMAEFQALVERTHHAGLKVIIDFVPNHVAREYFSDAKPSDVKDLGATDNSAWFFSPLNNFYYIPNEAFQPDFDIDNYCEFPAKVTGNDQFTAHPTRNDWYETVKLNYGVNYVEGRQEQFDPIPDTWLKMRDILLFWATKGVDGFRCDMAEMVPVTFWNFAITCVKERYPKMLFIAEAYNPAEYRNLICNGKFDYLYDKVGLYDTLRNIMSRSHPARNITQAWQSLGGIEDNMLNFLENHDEQRIGSGFFCGSGIYAHPGMIAAATLTRAPYMLYFGQETGELGMNSEGFSGVDGRTSIFDYCGVSSLQNWTNGGKFDGAHLTNEQRDLRNFYKKLNKIALTEKAISEGQMYDLEYANFNNPKFNTNEQFAYIRKFRNEMILVVLNFHDTAFDTEICIPSEAFMYFEIPEGNRYTCRNLLNESDTVTEITLTSKQPVCTTIDAWKGKILKLEKMLS